MKKRTFTLIELLVVVAIIAILAAILLPALSKARSRAKMAGCQSSLKQIASAILLYPGDNHDFFPPVISGIYGSSNDPYRKYLFAGNIVAYLGFPEPLHPTTGAVNYYQGLYSIKLLYCPASSNTDSISLTGYNPYLSGTSETTNPVANRLKVFKVGGVKHATRKILVSDWQAGGAFFNNATGSGVTGNVDLYNRHNKQMNYAFVDGHVKPYPVGSTQSSGGLQCSSRSVPATLTDTTYNFSTYWLPDR